jgi:HK97 family phage major capsid protein
MYFKNQIEKHKKDRWELVQRSRSVLEGAEKENRSMTTEERSEIDKMNEAITGHETRIADLEKLNRDDDQVEGDGDSAEVDDALANEGERSAPGVGQRRGRTSESVSLEGRGRNGDGRFNSTRAYRSGYKHFLRTGELRDMTLGTQASGGYLVAPVQTSTDIIKQTDNLVFVRQLARIYNLDNAQALGVRQMTARVSDADWTTEIGAITADSALAFNRRDLTPNQLTKLVLVSLRLMESGQDIEPTTNEELAYKFAVSQEKGFMTGTGSGQPLGVFTASANGVPTAQDVTSGATADFIADDLIKMKYSLKQTYFGDPACRWAMGRAIAQEVRTFKDSYGQYLWRAGLASDKPDTILDVPLAISEYAPVVKTTGSYIAVLGNFKYYAIAQVKNMWIQRLVELYAATSEVGFLGRWFVDGSPVLGEAFARLKTSA